MLTTATLFIRSATFRDGERMPQSTVFNGWGHQGANRSPQLFWSGAPDATRSFVLECHDPDAPTGIGFTHWVVYDIPPDISQLEENVGAHLPPGAKAGLNDSGKPGYIGPAPPPGPAHRYIFTLYALSVETLGIGEGAPLALVRFALREKKLAEGRITGLYGAE